MSTLNLRLEVIRFPKIGSVPEMDREATLQREPTCQAGGQKKNIEMQRCGVVPKGADISYAPRLNAAAPRTRDGSEMVSIDQLKKEPSTQKKPRGDEWRTRHPGRDEMAGTTSTGRGLINPRLIPEPNKPSHPRRSTGTNATTRNPGKNHLINTPFCFIRNQTSFLHQNSKET